MHAKRWLQIGVVMALPLLLAGVLRERASWRPRTLLHNGGIHALAFSVDGTTITAAGGNLGQMAVWDVQTGAMRHQSAMLGTQVGSVVLSPDGKMAATRTSAMPSMAAGNVQIWNLKTGRLQRALPLEGNYVLDMAFSPDGKILISDSATPNTPRSMRAGMDNPGGVRLWDVGTGRLKQTLPQPDGWGGSAVAMASDGKMVAGGNVMLWNAQSHKLHRKLAPHSKGVRQLLFSPNGEVLASGGNEGRLCLWDVRSGRLLHTLATGASANVLAFSPDGILLASGHEDKLIRLWDVKSGQLSRICEAHRPHWIHALAFSPQGDTLASGGSDRTVKLWRIR